MVCFYKRYVFLYFFIFQHAINLYFSQTREAVVQGVISALAQI